MKTKAQKQEALDRAKELLKTSQTLIFTDFSRISSEDLRQLRRRANEANAKMFVLKKRLLKIALKEKGIDPQLEDNKTSVGAIFSPSSIEDTSAPVFKFFKELKLENEKILGGWDLVKNEYLSGATVAMIGNLPPREVLLGQLVGMLASPIRSFLFVLSEKSKQTA
jgi:large subunit ribosomal protein L10